ncbi:hypothetical protein BIFGAL_03158 [Bifidobacterium gallicum DSM 20093 = LMG 11596]|uniref:Uncharacterized protein n=1 Tax=Bifidobacterium gallicum DSM 20093 = LMG 11596 TaxID=561180 RepID=D1NTK1_9BIFI|nr:hypothetical protein BIFGAL_03158 [Bifidobacterium gallicum DSM 20093 = LMG 11596]
MPYEPPERSHICGKRVATALLSHHTRATTEQIAGYACAEREEPWWQAYRFAL